MLKWTGERFLPWLRGAGAEIHYEHLHRYSLALHFTDRKRVLDLGCGEGYGSFLLAKRAAHVVGLDIDERTIEHARSRYGPVRENLTFIQGSVTEVPVDDAHSFDVIVCFETLEHVEDHAGLFREVHRLLTPTGVFIVSTPNKYVYSDQPDYRNQFHLKELYFDQFEAALRDNFAHVSILGQSVFTASFTWDLRPKRKAAGQESLVERTANGYRHTDGDRKRSKYFIGIASAAPLPDGLPTENRLLDVSNGFIEEYNELYVHPRMQALQDETARVRSEIAELQSQARQREVDHASDSTALQRVQSDLAAGRVEIKRLSNILDARERELVQLRRASHHNENIIGSRQAELRATSRALSARESDVERLTAELRRLDASSQLRGSEATRLADLLSVREREFERLKGESEQLVNHCRSQEVEARRSLDEIRRTISWRLTTPLRWTSNAARRARRSSAPRVALDEPSPNIGTLTGDIKVGGWAASSCPIARVEILCNGVEQVVTGVGLPRPDVAAAYPQFVDGDRSGFSLLLDGSRLPSGPGELVAQVVDSRGRTTRVVRHIVIAEAPVVSAAIVASAIPVAPAAPLDNPEPHAKPVQVIRARPSCKSFALYTSSLGNYFFNEIRDLLAAGLVELGFAVETRDERHGFSEDADWHVVVAPHEFFQLGVGRTLLDEQTPQQLILLNTEQPSTQWFSLAFDCFPRAFAIWDISLDSSRLIAQRGYRSSYLALGYAAGFEAAAAVAELPSHYGTSFLEPDIRKRPPDAESFESRPIDLLFIGHASRRRERFFAKAASLLSRHRCYLHFSSATTPIIPGLTTHMDTATVIGLAQRSKILLNIHHGQDQYFEWHRIVVEGIWQKALVISEPCGVAPPFRAGVDFVEASLDDIPDRIHYHLSDPTGRAKASQIIQSGYRTLTEKCRLADSLRQLILELHAVPQFPPEFSGVDDVNPVDRTVAIEVAPTETPEERDIAIVPAEAIQPGSHEGSNDLQQARQSLSASPDLSTAERHLVSRVSAAIHSADDMYVAPEGGHHYLSVGLSASRCIQAALQSAHRKRNLETILDFPCGYGRVLRFLRAMFPKTAIVGGEFRQPALDFSRQAFGAESFLSSTDFARLSLPRTFDLIWCGSLMTHIDEQAAVELMRFFHRHLNDGGICVFTTHGRRSVEWMQDAKHTYGLTNEARLDVLNQFESKGYGYADYPGQSGYGISVVSRPRMIQLASCVGGWEHSLFLEHGWADHHDVYAFAAATQERHDDPGGNGYAADVSFEQSLSLAADRTDDDRAKGDFGNVR